MQPCIAVKLSGGRLSGRSNDLDFMTGSLIVVDLVSTLKVVYVYSAKESTTFQTEDYLSLPTND